MSSIRNKRKENKKANRGEERRKLNLKRREKRRNEGGSKVWDRGEESKR